MLVPGRILKNIYFLRKTKDYIIDNISVKIGINKKESACDGAIKEGSLFNGPLMY